MKPAVALVLAAAVLAPAAAARSTWSPCGLSMLSTITPFGERSRRHRYPVTAAWFVAGALVGGATLGGAAALIAAVVSWSGVGAHPGAVLTVGAVLCAVGAALDAGLFGPVLPLIRRQVDDGWLARYRPWFYAAGFGWQIGVGLATYLMTAGVVVVAVLAALTASPPAAVLVCCSFGLWRGLTVLLTAKVHDPSALRVLHARLDRCGPAVRNLVAALQGGAAGMLAVRAVAAADWAAVAGAAGAAAATLLAMIVAPSAAGAPACATAPTPGRVAVPR